ncbi:type VI secretion system tube protein Hcp [Radicibacter daui]|uniref:type VI secretion system tube protein Hcp n=1 Tax=Radicibacter daui TaxID=3064829 RepID=UPI00404701CC
MAVIILKIPLSATTFITGDSTLYGFENLPLVDRVSYGISGSADWEQGKRTSARPTLSALTIARNMDVATAQITRLTLKANVSTTPWELLFFRSLAKTDASVMQFMSLKLYNALCQSQEIDGDSGDVTETLKVTASKMEWKYTAYGPNQTAVGNFAFSYDMQLGSIS